MSTECELVTISITFPSRESALPVREALLQQHLAASVQLMGPMESAYWWRGALQETSEYLMLVKARSASFEAVRALVEALHPYQLPEVIAAPICAAGPDYRAWVLENTAP